MTKVVLISSDNNLSFLAPHIQAAAPELEVLTYGDPGANEADIAACWNPPRGALAAMPNLKLIHGIAAGVDNILSDPLRPDLPLCRVVDPAHARGMSEFVTWAVMHFYRQLDLVTANQQKAVWFRPQQRPPEECRVGVMGLGEIGSHVAQELSRLGLSVRGWTRQAREVQGVKVFAGAASFEDFLSECEILVCLLPLTSATKGILNANTFAAMPIGAKLIQVGRGEHLVTEDLLDALSSGQLGGAVVDVFEREPLAADSPLWHVPNLFITPHMASVAQSKTIGLQIAQNARRLMQNEPLVNQVDVNRGY